MSIKLQIDQVEAALITVGLATLNASPDNTPIDVDSIGSRDFDDDGDLVLVPPCIRVRFADAQYETLRDNQKLTYGGKLLFDFFVFAENLRSKQDERTDTLQLVSRVADCFAGARLNLADGTWTEPTDIVSVVPVMNEGSIVDQFYAVTIRVNGLAQFSGVNANFGAR